MIHAFKKGQWDLFDWLVPLSDVDATTASGYSLLDLAADAGASRVAALLLANGATADRPGRPEGFPSALLFAANGQEPGHVACVEMLLPLSDLAAVDSSKSTALHRAAQSGAPKNVELLLAAGARADARDTMGRTPLSRAILSENESLAKVGLLLPASDAKNTDDRGMAPLALAARRRDSDAVERLRALLPLGDLDAVDDRGESALHDAAEFGPAESVKLLIAAGANAKIASKSAITPLMGAARSKKNALEKVRALLPKSAVRARFKEKCGAMHVAIASEKWDVALELAPRETKKNRLFATRSAASAGLPGELARFMALCDAEMPDSGQETALMAAASGTGPGYAECLRLLLGWRLSDLAATDKKGDTALHAAVEFGSSKAVEMLLASGADANAENQKGVAALGCAVTTVPEAEQKVQALLTAGADPKGMAHNGARIMQAAIRSRNERMVDLLLSQSPEPPEQKDVEKALAIFGRERLPQWAALQEAEAIRAAISPETTKFAATGSEAEGMGIGPCDEKPRAPSRREPRSL